MDTYHVFLSCDDDINIEDKCIEEFLSEKLPKEIVIESIKKHDNIKLAQEDLNDLEKSCIYVVDTHKDFDNITYWELGYAMGKGIEVIGYYDGTPKEYPFVEDWDKLGELSKKEPEAT
jgi:nucleoside 2-deoxyribosyltransferase